MNETVAFDPREYQNILLQSVQQAYKSYAPTWLESLVMYIQLHPWISIGIALGAALIISAIIREILCHYFKTNEILNRLKKLEEHLGRD